MATVRNSDIAVIKNEIKHIRDGIDEIKDELKTKYVTKEEFNPVKKIVYGAVAFILVGVMGGLLALVIV